MKICKAPGCTAVRYESPKGKKYSHCTLHKSRMSRLGTYNLPDLLPARAKTQKDYYYKHKEKADLIKRGDGYLIYCAACSKSFVSQVAICEWAKAPLCTYCKNV